MRRRLILAAGAAIGAVAVVLAIAVSGRDVSSWPIIGWDRGKLAAPAEPHDHHHDDDDAAKENKITLSDAQMATAGIDAG